MMEGQCGCARRNGQNRWRQCREGIGRSISVAPLELEIDGSYASPCGSMHGCHWSSSAWASQNQFLHVVQRTVAG